MMCQHLCFHKSSSDMHLDIIILIQYINDAAAIFIFKPQPVILIPRLKKFLGTGDQIDLILALFKKFIYCPEAVFRPLIIGIQKIHVFSADVGNGMVPGRTHSLVFLLKIDNIIRIPLLIFQTDLFTPVRTPVIHQNDLNVFLKSNILLYDGIQRLTKISVHVIDRYHHRELILIFHRFSPSFLPLSLPKCCR